VPKKVQIINKRNVFQKFIFRVEEIRLRHEKYDGTMSKEMVRLNLDRGDAVAGVIHLTDSDEIVMTEQFRYPTYEKGPGWLLEIPAGMLKQSERPEDAMRRELLEETGYVLLTIEHIGTFYLSPGGTSERIHLYYAGVQAQNRVGKGGGVEHEGEDIRTVLMPVTKLETMLHNHELQDAKTLVGMQWLLANRARLRSE
jgi:nudix-type nucleoside diphosphatase (YffH/AdpP family)